MWIRIDGQSGVPIYRQIAQQIEQAVVAGMLASGDKLPGVRDLAIELAVNPATVARAYDELQRAGVIEQPRGRGTFVRSVPALPLQERRERLRAGVEALVAEAERLGFGRGEVTAMLREVLGAGSEEDRDAGH